MARNIQEMAENWSKRLASSGEKIRQGVRDVSVAPSEKAIRQKDAYLQGVQEAVADGSWEAGLRRVTLPDWQKSMTEKGIPRISSGAAAAKQDFADFLGEFIPHIEAGERMLDTMPRGTFDQNVARAVAMMTHNKKFKRKK